MASDSSLFYSMDRYVLVEESTGLWSQFCTQLLVSLYIMEVICYIRKHHQFVELDSNIHAHNTRRKMDIHIQSILSGNFPTRLKYSIIKPVYKKGDRENVANYRPISLLTAFSKVFEKIIYDRLLKHIETNNILTDNQFGFRTFSSTDKASYKLIDGILDALNNKMMVGGIFCDLQKAFYCINYNILLTKLKFYGITGKTH